MTNEYVYKKQPYRWVMVVLLMLTGFSTNQAQFQLSVFSAEFMADFGINATQFSAVLLAYTLVAGVLGFTGGALADRYGARRVFVIMAFCSAFGALVRLLTDNFTLFFVLSLLIGALFGSGFAIAGKVISAWFPPKELNTAFCLYGAGGALGLASGQGTAGLYSGWQQALLISGMIILATALLWLFFGKNAPEGMQLPPSQPVLKYIRHVVKVKSFWLVVLCCIINTTYIFSFSSQLPTALQQSKALDLATAGVYASLLNASSIIGAIVIPYIYKVWGNLRTMLVCFSLLLAVVTASLWFIEGALVPVMIALTGFVMSAGAGLLLSLPARIPSLGYEYLGSANGIIALLQFILGGFVISSYVVTPLIGSVSSHAFFVCAGLGLVLAVLMLLIPAREINDKPREAME